MFLQTAVTGLAIGGIYALMAVGYSLVFSILDFSSFAHGTVIILGAYAGYVLLTQVRLPFALVISGSMAVAAVLGFLNERLAYRP
jgi:branched-chain amino acid transport system permease protein